LGARVFVAGLAKIFGAARPAGAKDHAALGSTGSVADFNADAPGARSIFAF
jgi:hypothetical protein